MNNKFAFLSDIHGNINALEKVLEDIKNRGIAFSNVYCTGDVIGYGNKPNEVIKLLKENNITLILGNHDKKTAFYDENKDVKINDNFLWTKKEVTAENKAYLKTLPEKLSINLNGMNILLIHASPNSISEYIYKEDEKLQAEIANNLKEDIIIFGHTHLAYSKYVNGKLFLNAGSVGRQKDGNNRAGYAILTIDKEIDVEFIKLEYDFEKMALEIKDIPELNPFASALLYGK